MKILYIVALFTLSLYAKTQTIVFGAGCFWGVEKYFDNLKGVKKAISGYAGGDYENPKYEDLLKHRKIKDIKNHTEVVKVIYDDSKISTKEIIEKFWELHDPTQGDRQGNDIGNNYRSAIYYTTNMQKDIALQSKKIYQKLLNSAGYGKITTEIAPLKKFYKAEDYHQDYLKKHPNGYCPNHSTGVKFKKEREDAKFITPLNGKEVVVIDAKNCPFCEKFKKNVLSKYKGDTPIRSAYEDMLKGFDIKTKVIGTPTILFIEDGKEVASFTGYMDNKSFYKTLAEFKLGRNSEAYRVAYHAKTDAPFCKKYDKFKNTKDGVFIDKISKEVLFDTKDRFNSHSGWLSFFKAVDNAVEFREDNSLGLRRIEVIAKKSGAHLGHVFDDAPGGRKRFCINASVLEFVPREDIKK